MQSEQINELAAALAKAQAEIEGAAKDKVNPHFRSSYADLASVWDACRAALTKHGLSVVQAPGLLDGAPVLNTTLMHTSGQWVTSTILLACDIKNMQALGSAITYARRYGLAAMVGVCPEDDDGNAAATSTQGGRESHAREAMSRAEQPSYDRQRETVNQYADARRERQNGHGGDHDNRPPRTGKALFAWAKKQQDEGWDGLIDSLNSFGKSQRYPFKMVEWSESEVSAALEWVNTPAEAG